MIDEYLASRRQSEEESSDEVDASWNPAQPFPEEWEELFVDWLPKHRKTGAKFDSVKVGERLVVVQEENVFRGPLWRVVWPIESLNFSGWWWQIVCSAVKDAKEIADKEILSWDGFSFIVHRRPESSFVMDFERV